MYCIFSGLQKREKTRLPVSKDFEAGRTVLPDFEDFLILDHRVGASANSMDVLFATRETMEFALAQDGLRINIGADNATCIMIGVED